MNTKALVGILVIVAIVLIGFGFYKSYQANNTPVVTPAENTDEPGDGYTVDRINVKHQFKTGPTRHIIAGEIDLPTPCHLLNHTVTKSADGKTATIAFTAESNAEFCAQVISTRRFKVEIPGDQDMTFNATYNGKEMILNIFEAAAGEDLDNFEIEIKG